MRVSEELSGQQRRISGIVTAVENTQLAFEVRGTVAAVEVALGDTVEADQVLARLDPEPFELAVRDAEASRAQARAGNQEAKVSHDRTIALFNVDVASAAERDRAIALRDAASSQVDAAEARLNLARRDLRRSVLRAPFRGSISVREIDPAQEIIGGQVAFEMDSGESGLRVEAQVPETMIALVEQGQEVTVVFPPLGEREFSAVVSEVGTRAGLGNAFTVKADLTERISEIRPGMTAEVRFTLPRVAPGLVDLQGFMIPFPAVHPEPDEQFAVFVYDRASSTVQKRPVRLGGVRDNDVAILEGLEEGQIIATAGVSFLRDGQEVTLLELN